MAEAAKRDFCGALPVRELLPGESRAALLPKVKWTPGDRIDVSFLDGAPSIQEKVKKFAREWTKPGLANLRFIFRTTTTSTPIRISFKYEGNWSALGTECFSRHYSDMARPTMNFGGFHENTPDVELRRVVLHEFGHALGLLHEHQSPAGGIRWNEEQVYKDLSGPPNNWTSEDIYQNVIAVRAETNYTAFDPASIMLYPIPEGWTTDGLVVDWNNELSPVDRAFIRQHYP